MALEISANFNYRGKQPNFVRDAFNTLADMKAWPESAIDEGHVSYVLATKRRYEWSSSYDNDPQLGRWRLVSDLQLAQTTGDDTERGMSQYIITKELNDRQSYLEEVIQLTKTELVEKIDTDIAALADDIGNRYLLKSKLATVNGAILSEGGDVQIYAIERDTITIDTALSRSSVNPVQNKVITEALDAGFYLN